MVHFWLMTIALISSGCFSREDNQKRNALFEEVDLFDSRFSQNALNPELKSMLMQIDKFWTCSRIKRELTELPPRKNYFVADTEIPKYYYAVRRYGQTFERRHIHIATNEGSYDMFVIVCRPQSESVACAAEVRAASVTDPGMMLGDGEERILVEFTEPPPETPLETILANLAFVPLSDLTIKDFKGQIHIYQYVLYAIAILDKKEPQNSAVKASCL